MAGLEIRCSLGVNKPERAQIDEYFVEKQMKTRILGKSGLEVSALG